MGVIQQSSAAGHNVFVSNPLGRLDFSGNVTEMFSAWIKPNGVNTGAVRMIVSKASNTTLQYQFYIGTTGLLSFNPNNVDGVAATTAVTAGVWQHVVALKNSGGIATYIGGVLSSTVPASSGSTVDTAQNFRIGGRDDGLWFDGEMAEVAVWRGGVGSGTDFTLLDITRLSKGESPLQLVHIRSLMCVYFPLWQHGTTQPNMYPIDAVQVIGNAANADGGTGTHPPVVPAWLH